MTPTYPRQFNINESAEKTVLSVSELNRKARRLLETQFSLIWVEGEISNFSRPSSGHWYFTLKDAGAQIRCAMFRNRNMYARAIPQNGQQLLVRGKLSLYEGRGDYQMIVEFVEDAGAGALQRAFEELKQKLQREGLFAQERKRELPTMPRRIGVISSPTGAALRDILSTFRRRFPAIAISVFPVAVQGEQAAPDIVAAIAQANRCDDIDALIVARGGGSIEDLWAFNEETVARALAHSRIPTVSAVGHETDFTIADFVADHRAATPTASAEILSPDREEWQASFAGMEAWLLQIMQRRLQQEQQGLDWLQARLRHPGERLRDQGQRLRELQQRLCNASSNMMRQKQLQLAIPSQKLPGLSPHQTIRFQNAAVSQLFQRLQRAIKNRADLARQSFEQQAELLHSLSPLATLGRGYAIVKDSDKAVVSTTSKLQSGDAVEVQLGSGSFDAEVTAVREQDT